MICPSLHSQRQQCCENHTPCHIFAGVKVTFRLVWIRGIRKRQLNIKHTNPYVYGQLYDNSCRSHSFILIMGCAPHSYLIWTELWVNSVAHNVCVNGQVMSDFGSGFRAHTPQGRLPPSQFFLGIRLSFSPFNLPISVSVSVFIWQSMTAFQPGHW